MWPVIKNNLQLLLARKGMLFVLLIMPVILFAVGLFNNSSDTFSVNLGVVDHDGTVLSQALADTLKGETKKLESLKEGAVNDALASSKYDAALFIPQGYEAALLEGKTPQMVMRTLKGQEFVVSLKAFVDMQVADLLRLRQLANAQDGQALLAARDQALAGGMRYEEKAISPRPVHAGLAFASGFLLYVLSISMLQVGGLILEEKHWNTLQRIRQAPVSRSSYLIANFLTGVIFLLINMVSLWALTRFVFHIQTTLAMYLLWLLYGIIWIFSGIFLALVVRSRSVHASVSPILTTIFAMIGGLFWPLWLMPDFMKKLAMITPQYWANDAIALIQKGQSLLSQRTDLLALLGFLILFFALGIFSLRRLKHAETFI